MVRIRLPAADAMGSVANTYVWTWSRRPRKLR
jgi:hypothetical protein